MGAGTQRSNKRSAMAGINFARQRTSRHGLKCGSHVHHRRASDPPPGSRGEECPVPILHPHLHPLAGLWQVTQQRRHEHCISPAMRLCPNDLRCRAARQDLRTPAIESRELPWRAPDCSCPPSCSKSPRARNRQHLHELGMAIDQRPCGQRKHLRRKCQLDAQNRNGALPRPRVSISDCASSTGCTVPRIEGIRTRRDRHPHPVARSRLHSLARVGLQCGSCGQYFARASWPTTTMVASTKP
jgi:hypothetical protein